MELERWFLDVYIKGSNAIAQNFLEAFHHKMILQTNRHTYNIYQELTKTFKVNSIMICSFNSLSTTDLLTPFLIGSCHEMFICLANYNKALKMVRHKLAHDTIVSYTFPDWFNI